MTSCVRRLLPVSCCVLLLVLAVAPARAAGRDRVITGTVVDQSGHGVVAASVSFEDDPLLSGFASLACVFAFPASAVPGVCFPHGADTRTDSRGRYALRLKSGSSLALPGLRHLIVAGIANSAGLVRAGFAGDIHFTGSARSLPAVTLWTQPLRVMRANGRTRLTLTRPQGARGAGWVTWRGDDNKALAFQVPFAGDDADVDDRVYEDGTRSIDAGLRGSWAGLQAAWSSVSQQITTVGKATSRALPCGTYARGGALVRYASCPFTDGRLGTELGLLKAPDLEKRVNACLYSSDCSTPNALVLDLGMFKQLGAVVYRGCSGCAEHPVQLSLDGATWTDWVNQKREGARDAVVTGPPLVARYVRVQGDVFMTWDLREVSVWASPLLPV